MFLSCFPAASRRLAMSLLLLLPVTCASADDAESSAITYDEILARVVATYPSLESAMLQIDQSLLELDRIYSRLGWVAQAAGSVSHDLGNFGTPADVLRANASLSRLLESGDRVSLDANYGYTDNDLVLTPILPNPSNDTAVNLSYRRPLQKGAGNVSYHAAMQAAQAQVVASKADENLLRDQLADQVAGLYYGLAATEVNIDRTRDGIERLERLLAFVRRNQELGVSEEKDILQSQARLADQRTQLQALEAARNQQLYNLNRLTGMPASRRFVTRIDSAPATLPDRLLLRDEVFAYSPALVRAKARRTAAESQIEIQRDEKKDMVDVFVSVGARNKFGDAEDSSVNESDLAGSVGVEYRAALDKSGLNAALQQALLDRDIAENDIRRISDDLDYTLDRLLGRIRDLDLALQRNREHLAAERRKFDDAVDRYTSGRIDIAELILFETDLSSAEASLVTRQVSLQQVVNELQRLRGAVWSSVTDQP